jgi:hypothetical protein
MPYTHTHTERERERERERVRGRTVIRKSERGGEKGQSVCVSVRERERERERQRRERGIRIITSMPVECLLFVRCRAVEFNMFVMHACMHVCVCVCTHACTYVSVCGSVPSICISSDVVVEALSVEQGLRGTSN